MLRAAKLFVQSSASKNLFNAQQIANISSSNLLRASAQPVEPNHNPDILYTGVSSYICLKKNNYDSYFSNVKEKKNVLHAYVSEELNF